MTHIDPFAPADSPQHPRNWTATQYPADLDATPPLVALPGDPESVDTDDIDDRWAEYGQLLVEHGTPAQADAFDNLPGRDWPDDMPTLVELRERRQQAVKPARKTRKPKPAEADLQAALAELDD